MKPYVIRVASGLLCIATTMLSNTAFALPPAANFNDWSLFTAKKSGKDSCYIASLPTSKRGTYTKRGDPYLLVTYKTRALDEVSLSAGFAFAEKSEASLSINSHTYPLFTKDELAWAYDAATDIKLVEEMKNTTSLQVTSTSKKGTYAVDTYSLTGFTAAYKRM